MERGRAIELCGRSGGTALAGSLGGRAQRDVSVAPPDIVLHDVTIAYRGHPAVHHVSGSFRAGSLSAVVGPNGAGKSTLLEAVAGIRRLTQGQISGVRAGQTQQLTQAYLPQRSGINHDFPLRVFEVVALGAWQHTGAFRGVSGQLSARIQDALGQVGLQGFDARLVDELSVGQLQRVLFARLIVQDAPVILLDEPFNALDTKTTLDLLQIVLRWHQAGRTVIAVIHDLQMVREYFEQVLLMAREQIAWGPVNEVLTPALLEAAYGRSLAWQTDAAWCQDNPPVAQGESAHDTGTTVSP